MFTLKEAKNAINNGVYDYVKKKGYQLKSASDEFVLSNLNSDYIFYLIYTKRSGYISLAAYAYIRNKKVEKIYGEIINENWKSNWTLGSEVCIIRNSKDGRKQINEDCSITITDESSLQNAIGILIEYFNDIAIPFYKKYDDLNKMDDLYNNPPFDEMPVLVQRTLADQCMKGLIIAKLVNRKNFNELVKVFDELILIPDAPDVFQQYKKLKSEIINIASLSLIVLLGLS